VTRKTRRSAAALLGVFAALCVAGPAAAIPLPPDIPPNLHCHTPWQIPVHADGHWQCAGGPGPVIRPNGPLSHN